MILTLQEKAKIKNAKKDKKKSIKNAEEEEESEEETEQQEENEQQEVNEDNVPHLRQKKKHEEDSSNKKKARLSYSMGKESNEGDYTVTNHYKEFYVYVIFFDTMKYFTYT